MLQQNLGRRPIVWALTSGRSFAGLAEYVVQRGLGFELLTAAPDTTDAGLDLHRLTSVPLDVGATERLLFETYRFAGLLEHGADRLEPTSAGIATTLALPAAQLAYAFAARGERQKLERAMNRAVALSPNPELHAALRALLADVGSAAPGTRRP